MLSVVAQALLFLFFCVQVRNCFLFPVMLVWVVSGKFKPMRVGLCIGILRLRVLMDVILF
jgi:hypothetical protein